MEFGIRSIVSKGFEREAFVGLKNFEQVLTDTNFIQTAMEYTRIRRLVTGNRFSASVYMRGIC